MLEAVIVITGLGHQKTQLRDWMLLYFSQYKTLLISAQWFLSPFMPTA
jgi:hypothetical protein